MLARNGIRLLVLALIVALLYAVQALPIAEWLQSSENWARENPLTGAALFIALTIVAALAMTPGWVPMTLAGLLFGLGPGIVYAMIGISVGATAAMLAGRTLARSWIERRISGNERMRALDDALGEQAFAIVALTRMALVIPFNVLNYAYGLTRVDVRTYSLATAVGMLPIVSMYVYLGTLARDIGQVLAGEVDPGIGTWWIAGIGVAVITIVVAIIRRTVIRVLDEKLESRRALKTLEQGE
ncbi:MAG: TVP38/TMEM64 family protein [Woeseiaceae bacterium]|nr:TVP38/TMEM64 family protein [Woeseiaceae bacterium]